jgi:antitoxin (DNA-binding transcriptional repressor) of toxin-antitoxin stability system
VKRLTATEAARRFCALLDQVEHEGERFLVERRGRVIASVAPAVGLTGRAVKDLLRAQPVDEQWAEDLALLRAGVEPE